MNSELRSLRAEVSDLRDELELLRSEVSRLRRSLADIRLGVGACEPVAEYSGESEDSYSVVSEYPASSAPRSLAEGYTTSGSLVNRASTPSVAAGPPCVLSWKAREDIADEIGSFIARSVAGHHRGPSGREKVPLASRLWVVGGDPRLIDIRRCGEGTGTMLPDAPTTGSSQYRPWRMGFGLRVIARRLAALLCPCQPHCSVGERRRTTQPTFGSTMGGDQSPVPEGPGRLSAEEEEHRQNDFGSPHQDQGFRGDRFSRSTTTKAQAQSKGQSSKFPAGPIDRTMESECSRPFAKDAVPDNLKLPGSAASSIRVPAFLNSMPRWLLSIRCGFQGFLRSILMNPGRPFSSTCTTNPLWPIPLPFPEVFGRSAACNVAMAHVKRLVSLQVAVLDWFVLGRPISAPDDIRLGRSLSSRQWTVVRRLQDLVVDGNTPEFIDAGDMGRSASKNEDQEKCLEALCRAVSMAHVFDGYFGNSGSRPDSFDDSWLRCGCLVGRNPCNAKPIVADRLTVPDEPRFDPLPHFDRKTAYRYEHPISGGRDPSEVESPPVVQIRASGDEKIRLLCKLAGAGMLKPIESNSFHCGFENGMFAVNKDSTRDRLVLDSRASNLLDRGQSVWSGGMASAMSLCSIYIDDNRVLLSSGEDLKDYFYQFRVNGERTSRNALKVILNADEFRLVFGCEPPHDGSKFHVGLSTLAMGDVCAVEYAQCSHIALCLKHQVFSVDEMISLKVLCHVVWFRPA